MAHAKVAREVMTANPVCCTVNATLDEVARLMIEGNCGEIPVIDTSQRPIGVVTDRDIVCRVVAEGKNPMGYTVETCMTQPVVTVLVDMPLDQVVSTMQQHQVRRVPVVDAVGCCVGIISQADIARAAEPRAVAELVREVSRDTGSSCKGGGEGVSVGRSARERPARVQLRLRVRAASTTRRMASTTTPGSSR